VVRSGGAGRGGLGGEGDEGDELPQGEVEKSEVGVEEELGAAEEEVEGRGGLRGREGGPQRGLEVPHGSGRWW